MEGHGFPQLRLPYAYFPDVGAVCDRARSNIVQRRTVIDRAYISPKLRLTVRQVTGYLFDCNF